MQRILGLKAGDTFTLSSAGVQDRIAEVVEIVSKYVFRFQDSMAQYQARFPERHDLQQVRLLREGGEENDLDLSPILASLTAGLCPISARFANMQKCLSVINC